MVLGYGCSVVGREGSKVLFIVVRVVPDGSGRGGVGIDEELVLRFGVEFADPARGDGAKFVFHASSCLQGDAVAGSFGADAVCCCVVECFRVCRERCVAVRR